MAVIECRTRGECDCIPGTKEILWYIDRYLVMTEGDIPVSAQAPSPRSVSVMEFRSRFTDAEMTAILIASRTDATVALFLLKLQTRTEIDLDDPNVSAGLTYLTAATLLAAGRKSQLLA